MSVIRPSDASSTSYGDGSDVSTQPFSADKRFFHYASDSYRTEIHGFPGPTNVSPLHVSSLTNQGSMHNAGVSSTTYQLMANARASIISDNPYESCFAALRCPDSSSSSNDQSLERDRDFAANEMRLKLQELEQTLLNDNEEELSSPDQEMGIGEGWAEPIKDLLMLKESSSESSIGCAGNRREVHTPKQLLFDCAAAIYEGSVEEAQAMITELRQMVSIQGDPPQRLAACLVEGLAARMASSGGGIYKALNCKEPPASDRLSAMQILFEVCPCFKFGFMAANYAIIDAFKGEERVHIIDFDINQGSQYVTLISALSSQLQKPPRLRLTGVDDPESVQRPVGGLKVIGMWLEKLAEDCGVQFEFRAIAAKTADVTPSMLDCRPGEALAVNFAFQLHHMPDESVSTVNQRDRLLRMVKGLAPKLVTLVEQDVNTNTAPFFPRFVEVYNYYSAVFESLDATLPRGSADRMNVERQCLARDIVNIIACEGTDRIERYEAAGKWRARMTMAGFAPCPFNADVRDATRAELKSYSDRYNVKEESGALYFGWADKILVVASAWK